MRNTRVVPRVGLSEPAGEVADVPLGRVTVSDGAITYAHLPVRLGPEGERLQAPPPGFGTLVPAGRQR